MASTSQVSLAERFRERAAWYGHRAAALFPVYLRPGADTSLLFLDYWRLKKGLRPVTVVLRVYDPEGRLVHRHAEVVERPHNHVSLSGVLGTHRFDGTGELEAISQEDLAFRMPAITVVYRSGERMSAVHARGRVRNADEPYVPAFSTETNWPCKSEPGMTPFFHLFNGPRGGGLGVVEVRLMGSSTQVLSARTLDCTRVPPFWSRLLLLDELFEGRLPPGRDWFAAVQLPDAECFPGAIAGTLFRELDFVEASHTFYWTAIDDYLEATADVPRPSFLPIMNVPPLDLELVGFPTNAPAALTGTVRRGGPGETLLATDRRVAWVTGGDGVPLWRHRAEPGVAFECIDFTSGRVPARLNATYMYSVRGADPRFTTAVSWGAYACVYPPRRSHWGHGFVSPRTETVVMVRNVAHGHGGGAGRAELKVWDASGLCHAGEVAVPAESAVFVALKPLVGAGTELRSVSWLLKSDNTDLDTLWVSWSPEGSACGDHGF